ncbi:MAG: patatin-like phospholipase family protein [Campylobacteraceae bacterium]|jgi:NTE family protein|nr:patatin-like phospholipase family protein [Campylobacteraceae bacterium]
MNLENGISLVLSGGGARGAFHLGILQALDELKIPIREISGASIGAIVGAFYLAGKTPIEIFDFFDSYKFRDVLKLNIFKGSLFRIDTKHKFFDEMLGEFKNIEDFPQPLHVSITDIKEGVVLYCNKGDIKKIVTASGALYPIFETVDIGEGKFMDGGVMDNFPLQPLLNTKYRILGSNLHPNVYKPKQSTITRALFLTSMTHGMKEKIKRCDYYLAPRELANHNILSLKKLDKLFTLGYEEAKRILTPQLFIHDKT